MSATMARLVTVETQAPDNDIAAPCRPAFVLASSLLVDRNATSGAAEALRALRTHLMAQHFEGGRRALAICGASGGVGCSFVASNLAVALSQIGMRTLLMDANLRDPSVDGLFGVSAQSVDGLSDCLSGERTAFRDFIQPDVLPDLSLMFAGTPAENPQELLASSRFHALMEFCMREFQATIVDTAPANICADARRVSTVTGYSLIVVRRNLSYVDDVKTLAEQLASDRAAVVGCVLNEA